MLSNGTKRDSFLKKGEKLTTASGRDPNFDVTLGQTKAEDIEWLVIGCEYEGTTHKVAFVKFENAEDNVTEQNITDGSSHLQSGLFTNLALTLSMSYFLMK